MDISAICEKIQSLADSARQLSKAGKSEAAAQMRRLWAEQVVKALAPLDRKHDNEIANLFNKLAMAKGGFNG